MATKKKQTAKDLAAEKREAETEPGFFSDYGYGNGALILHDPPQKPKNATGAKPAKGAKNKRK